MHAKKIRFNIQIKIIIRLLSKIFKIFLNEVRLFRLITDKKNYFFFFFLVNLFKTKNKGLRKELNCIFDFSS